jgi:branched-chain amino acid transport system substrate-binding protein
VIEASHKHTGVVENGDAVNPATVAGPVPRRVGRLPIRSETAGTETGSSGHFPAMKCAETPRRTDLIRLPEFGLSTYTPTRERPAAHNHLEGRRPDITLGGSSMMKRILAASAALAMSAALAQAQEVKVGLVAPFTGIGAELGQQIDRGVEQYLKLNAAEFKPYTIKVMKRDDKNPSGADSKIAVQELLTQENVQAIAGWIYSPNAIASAPVITAGKKLGVIMNAGTAHITNMSKYFVRTSFSMWHAGYALGEAAAKQLKAKTAVVGYSDFPPGKDSLAAFKRAFEANGGKVIDEIPMGGAGQVPDFTPFFQRAKDKKPDVFFVFVPAGDHALAVVKTYAALGMRAAGIKLIGPGDITEDIKLQAMGDAAIGLITMHHYNADLDNPQNKKLVASWHKDYGPDATPDFVAVGAYDGMAAIAHAIVATKGKMDGDAAVKSLLGWKYNSPRGPIMIDPETRDIVMNEYLSEVVKGPDGKLHQKKIGEIDHVKDACKAQKIGPCAPK